MKDKKEILFPIIKKYFPTFEQELFIEEEHKNEMTVIYEAMEKYKDEWWEEQTKKLEE